MTNATHDPALRSWVESANDGATDFPVQNLPWGVFRDERTGWRVGVAIGDRVLDVAAAARAGVVGEAWEQVTGPTLNALMAESPAQWTARRRAVSDALRADTEAGRRAAHIDGLTRPLTDVELGVPATVGDYTDFYASIHHATNVGSMFRPDNPLLPNYKWVPIGYHGRASSIVASGTPIRRPIGQWSAEAAGPPTVAPTRRLDYELELGLWIGGGNALGIPVPIQRAGEAVFGVSLLNDWSARDVQAWEYQPLGPFLAKNFATTVGQWVVTSEALAPFRSPATSRAPGDPAPLSYLLDAGDQAAGGIDVRLEVWLRSERMRSEGMAPHRLSLGSSTDLYWTPAQFVAHHTMGGCNLRAGDLLGTGTISGADPGSRGCLLELTWRGSQPLRLPSGEERRFLEDGDEVTIRARAERAGAAPIGFGTCTGVVMPAA
ncbi:MAG: fumarylacetoacetase [Gemmatimonadaceae bacterium]|nr:fumarylacetoacetase [Gemmatimonadaceae bacterium]